VLLQKSFGEQADDVVSLDEATVLVEQKTAVEVAVPGDADVGAMLPHGFGSGFAVLRQ
jgi:hypothetical protein